MECVPCLLARRGRQCALGHLLECAEVQLAFVLCSLCVCMHVGPGCSYSGCVPRNTWACDNTKTFHEKVTPCSFLTRRVQSDSVSEAENCILSRHPLTFAEIRFYVCRRAVEAFQHMHTQKNPG